MIVITAKTELRKETRLFQQALIAQAHSQGNREWAFPSGDRADCITYTLQTDLGEMLFAVPPPWDGRQAHLFKLNHEGGTLFPDAEINIPYELNRRVSGVLAADDDGQTLVCHRGTFTAFRGRVPRVKALKHFESWVQDFDDSGSWAVMISVTSTASPSIADDIGEFVREVKRLKEQVKAEAQSDPAVDVSQDLEEKTDREWRNNDEYEGDKSATTNPGTRDYTYLHGPLSNALRRKLNLFVSDHPDIEVGNHQVDVALVDRASGKAKAIFEVKTSTSMSAQLYSGFGQLAYYKHLFGTAETKLYLVLPESTSSDFTAGEFFAKANIHVIFGHAGVFRGKDGQSLEEMLRALE
ncbi:hypothetical protein [Pseudomonas syringae]|uniref:hypothetical protein n=1 Tax=Pseudomonas syringae TaxID=317 RepID=UPI000CDAE89F|nr:hypothetical protein [Pseudomonas syringae]POP76460.1 hypothetical protein CXB37_10325 [Pseudomonas syringae pv. syringae]